MTRRIKAVLFDAGGTLLRVHPSVGHVYADEARRVGVEVDCARIDEAFRIAWKRLRPTPGDGTPFHTSEEIERGWWRELVTSVFRDAGALDSFDGRFNQFFDGLYSRFERPDDWHVFEDVVPALNDLRAREIRCAVVSNWDSRLPRLLDAAGIGRYFEFVLTSAEAGWSKPHPEIFRQAIARMGLRAEDAFCVGDSIEEDVVGARNAGLRPLLISRSGSRAETGSFIDSLSGLADLL